MGTASLLDGFQSKKCSCFSFWLMPGVVHDQVNWFSGCKTCHHAVVFLVWDFLVFLYWTFESEKYWVIQMRRLNRVWQTISSHVTHGIESSEVLKLQVGFLPANVAKTVLEAASKRKEDQNTHFAISSMTLSMGQILILPNSRIFSYWILSPSLSGFQFSHLCMVNAWWPGIFPRCICNIGRHWKRGHWPEIKWGSRVQEHQSWGNAKSHPTSRKLHASCPSCKWWVPVRHETQWSCTRLNFSSWFCQEHKWAICFNKWDIWELQWPFPQADTENTLFWYESAWWFPSVWWCQWILPTGCSVHFCRGDACQSRREVFSSIFPIFSPSPYDATPTTTTSEWSFSILFFIKSRYPKLDHWRHGWAAMGTFTKWHIICYV